MSTVNENSVDVLNDLIRINNDRVEGYTKAIENTDKDNFDLVSTFERMKEQSRGYLQELTSMVNQYGGEVADSSTVMGKIYRTWMDVQNALTSDDRQNVLNECEFGEDAAQKAYKMALDESDLTEEARSLISTQKSALRESHDLIKAYRDREKVHA